MAFQVEWIIKARDQFSEVAKNISKSMDGITKNIENFNKSVKEGPKIIKQFSDLGDMLMKNFSLPLAAIAGTALNAARKYETLEAVFQGMAGSKKGADQYLSGLRETTDKLGIDFFDAAKGAQALYASGFKLKDIKPMVKTIGALSAGTGTNFNEIADQISEINTVGVFTGRNLRTFAGMHINIAQAIAGFLKMPVDEVTKKLNKGAQISAQSLNIVLQSYAQSKQFKDQIAAQQKTLSGSFQILMNSVDGVNIGMGEQINTIFSLAGAMRGLAKIIDKVDKNVIQAHPVLVQYAIKWGSLAAAIGPALIALKWAIKIFNLLFILPFKFLGTMIMFVGRTFQFLGLMIRFAFSNPVGLILTAITVLILFFATTKNGRAIFKMMVNAIIAGFKDILKFAKEVDKVWQKTIGGIENKYQSLKDKFFSRKNNVSPISQPISVDMRNGLMAPVNMGQAPLKAPIPVSQIMSQNPISSNQSAHSKVRVDVNVSKAPGLTVDVKSIQQASKNVSLNVGKNLFGAGVGA